MTAKRALSPGDLVEAVYLDGRSVIRATDRLSLKEAGGLLHLGIWDYGFGHQLKGRIDELRITDQIEEHGGRAMNLNFNTTNVLFGEPLRLQDDQGEPLDLGYVGQVTRVDRQVIENLCYAGQVPVIPSMCWDPKSRQKLNVNADSAAEAVAEGLGAEKLVFLSDVNGVRRDKDDATTLIESLTSTQVRELIRVGAIDSGMIPKVEACLKIIDRGVRKVHIIDGRLRHSLLLEIYTNTGVGTQIIEERS